VRRGDEACASSVLGVGSEDILSDVVSPDESCVYALTPLAVGLTTTLAVPLAVGLTTLAVGSNREAS